MKKHNIQIAILSLSIIGGISVFATANHATLSHASSTGNLTIEQLKAIEKSITADKTLITIIDRDGTIKRVSPSNFHPTTADNATIATVIYPTRNGSPVVHVPPVNFNPLTATDAELDYYNFPPRPKDPADLKRWEKVVSYKTFTIPVFGDPIPNGDPRFQGHVISTPNSEY